MKRSIVIRKKQEAAVVRQEVRDARSDEEQIAKLDSGHHVAAKERTRLQSRISIKKRIQEGRKTHGSRTK